MQENDQAARADELKARGNGLLKNGDAAAAIAAYTEAIELVPTNHVYFSNRSAAQLKLGDPGAALLDAEKCIELAPHWAKGFNRAAGALLDLGRAKEALAMADRGLGVDPDNNPLTTTRGRALHRDYCDRLRGTWSGKVHEKLGGYEQEFDFVNDTTVSIKVIGTSVGATYSIDPSHDPPHLNMTVPGPAPAVLHIFKLEANDSELHLCSPYMCPPDRHPTEFAGPAFVVMRRGALQQSSEDEAAAATISAMSAEEKLQGFLRDVASAIPEGKVMVPLEGESDVECAQKMAENVRFQAAYHKIKSRYGEDLEQRVRRFLLEEERPSNETTDQLARVLREKMIATRLMMDPATASSAGSQFQPAGSHRTDTIETQSPATFEDGKNAVEALGVSSEEIQDFLHSDGTAAASFQTGTEEGAEKPAKTTVATDSQAKSASTTDEKAVAATPSKIQSSKETGRKTTDILIPTLVGISMVCAVVAVAVWTYRGKGAKKGR